MTDLNKASLEELLQKLVDSGADLSSYRRSPTKLVVPPALIVAAQDMFDIEKPYEKDIDFE